MPIKLARASADRLYPPIPGESAYEQKLREEQSQKLN
jgi:hypothetical protein